MIRAVAHTFHKYPPGTSSSNFEIKRIYILSVESIYIGTEGVCVCIEPYNDSMNRERRYHIIAHQSWPPLNTVKLQAHIMTP